MWVNDVLRVSTNELNYRLKQSQVIRIVLFVSAQLLLKEIKLCHFHEKTAFNLLMYLLI